MNKWEEVMDQPELGELIEKLRKQHKLTQAELAQKCNLNIRTIQRIESGKVTPRFYTLRLLSNVFGDQFEIEKTKEKAHNLSDFIFTLFENLSIPRFSLILIGIFFVGFIAYTIHPNSIRIFGFKPIRQLDPLYLHTYITYSIIHVSFIHFFWTSLPILLAALILEEKLKRCHLLAILFVSAVLGPISYNIISHQDAPLVGGGFIYFGYISALLACYIKLRKKFTLNERIISLFNFLFVVFFTMAIRTLVIPRLIILITCFSLTYWIIIPKATIGQD